MSVADLERISYPSRRRSFPSGGRRWRRIRLTLIARWRAGELDRQLAAGASPGASALLAIRGQRLTSRGHRVCVAAGLARAVRDAEATTHRLSAAVGPDRRLTDGTSPLYQPAEPGALGSHLRAAAAALELPTRADPVRARRETLG